MDTIDINPLSSPEPGPEHGVPPVVELPALFEVGPQVGVEIPGQDLGGVVQDEEAVAGGLLPQHRVEGGPDLQKVDIICPSFEQTLLQSEQR